MSVWRDLLPAFGKMKLGGVHTGGETRSIATSLSELEVKRATGESLGADAVPGHLDRTRGTGSNRGPSLDSDSAYRNALPDLDVS